jgi:hypothetical protein
VAHVFSQFVMTNIPGTTAAELRFATSGRSPGILADVARCCNAVVSAKRHDLVCVRQSE